MPETVLPDGRPLEITTVAERPELAHADFPVDDWPEFMRHNRISTAYFPQTAETFPATCLIATVDGTPVADAQAVQLADSSRTSGGWEQAVVQAFSDVRRGTQPDTACALNISVAQAFQGQGIAALMLAALRQATIDARLGTLIAPVRPTEKHHEPRTPMPVYAARTRADGLPWDPWLRTHLRAGGQMTGLASTSWVIAGSLAEWRLWTGLPFEHSGGIEVPGALVPVECDVAADRAVYVEPNVWVLHRLKEAGPREA